MSIQLTIRSAILVATTIGALATHSAAVEYRLITAEERISEVKAWAKEEDRSLRRMQLTLCKMCVQILGDRSDCEICEG